MCVSSCGSSRLTPVSVDIDQLLCLPEPLIPANGFSWISAARSCRCATRLIVSIVSIWWSLAMWLCSNSGAISYCPGATSLCRVFTGTPSRHSSRSTSCMHASTRAGIVPKYWSSSCCPLGGREPNSVRSHDTRSGRAKNRSRSIRKYSCSGPTVVNTCDTPGIGAEHLEDAERLLGQRFHRAEQRDLRVERLAGPRHEGRRDAQRHRAALAPDQERRAGRVPRGVAAGLERRPQAARREARRIRLALHQVGTGEVEHHPALPIRRHQRVMLLGRQAGQRLEPVGEVGGAVLDRPVLHRGRDHVGHLRVQRLAPVDRPQQALVDLLRQPLAHDGTGKHIGAEDFINAFGTVGAHGILLIWAGVRGV